jgi:hypothetical protein
MKAFRKLVLMCSMLASTYFLVRNFPVHAQSGTPWGFSCSSEKSSCTENATLDYTDCISGCGRYDPGCKATCSGYRSQENTACTNDYNSCLNSRNSICPSWCGASCGNQAVTYSAYNDANFSCSCTCEDGSSGGLVSCGGSPLQCANGNSTCQFDQTRQVWEWVCPPPGGGSGGGGSSGGGGGSSGCVGGAPACSGGPATCDFNGAQGVWQWNCPPAPPCACNGAAPECPNEQLAQCVNNGNGTPCYWYCASPILLDVDGTGFKLTSAAEGVRFDLFGNGHPIQTAWTTPGSTNAWLELDRNENGFIDDATELFGTITPQPESRSPNGFLALAVFDQNESGGNGDGVIDNRDAVFSNLLLWQDGNHDGISQPEELHHLADLGIGVIDLSYKESKRQDEYGNGFRYRAHVWDTKGVRGGRFAWDVYPVTSP